MPMLGFTLARRVELGGIRNLEESTARHGYLAFLDLCAGIFPSNWQSPSKPLQLQRTISPMHCKIFCIEM